FRLDRVGPERLPELGDVDLHDLVRARGRIAPQVVDERVHGDHSAGLEQEPCEERRRLAAGKLRRCLDRAEQPKADHDAAMSELAAPGEVIGGYRLDEPLGEGTAALADFGLARGPDSTRLTAEGQLLGTPHYLAPELIEGGEATRQSDVYALGCVLFECLAGAPPFAGRGAAEIGFAHLTEPPPDPRLLRADLSEGLAHAVLNALEKDPAARPTTATALARMLMLGRRSSAP